MITVHTYYSGTLVSEQIPSSYYAQTRVWCMHDKAVSNHVLGRRRMPLSLSIRKRESRANSFVHTVVLGHVCFQPSTYVWNALKRQPRIDMFLSRKSLQSQSATRKKRCAQVSQEQTSLVPSENDNTEMDAQTVIRRLRPCSFCKKF